MLSFFCRFSSRKSVVSPFQTSTSQQPPDRPVLARMDLMSSLCFSGSSTGSTTSGKPTLYFRRYESTHTPSQPCDWNKRKMASSANTGSSFQPMTAFPLYVFRIGAPSHEWKVRKYFCMETCSPEESEKISPSVLYCSKKSNPSSFEDMCDDMTSSGFYATEETFSKRLLAIAMGSFGPTHTGFPI